MTCPGVPPHEFGQLEAVHARHLDVEQRERDIMRQKKFKRFLTGTRLEAGETFLLQQRFKRQQVLFEVIDQEEVDRLSRNHQAAPKLDRYDATEFRFMILAVEHASSAA